MKTKEDKELDMLFSAIGSTDEIWGVVGMGGIAFRFGPFQKNEVGALMRLAIDRGVGMTFVIQAGRDVPWDLMKEICPAEYSNVTEQES